MTSRSLTQQLVAATMRGPASPFGGHFGLSESDGVGFEPPTFLSLRRPLCLL